ncbi:MAG: tetratricopeptide (TPR) repeat protein [Psychromonas sp.]|jgi:tetratricopeptide (TPR) repeat protein
MLENLSGENLKEEFKNNKNARFATYAVGGVIVLALGYFAYNQFIYKPADVKSTEAGYIGLNYATMDSTDLSIEELTGVVKKFDGKKGGEVAQFVLARQLMVKGQYKKALKELEGVEVEDTYLKIYSIGLQADCYSDLKQYENAAKFYLEAAEEEANDFTTPMYLFKAALVSELKLNNPSDAADMYNQIKSDYPVYANQVTIDKYISRASNKTVK